MTSQNENIRNIAIIAHVDHGKTTLVDCLLKQAGAFRANQQVQERVLDSNDLERERGITILSKNISINYKNTKINVVDTPGHADFGGEVERVLGMVDGALLIVDAAEGPMPQTRFVLSKALELGLKIIVVINKIDKPAAEPLTALDKVFDLFTELTDREDLIDFPFIFSSSLNGFAIKDLDDERKDIIPLLDCILENIQPPKCDSEKPFQFRATTLDYNEYVGRIVIGRIENGTVKSQEQVSVIHADGSQEKGKRAGTENLAGIVGMTVALEAAVSHLAENSSRTKELRDRLISGLSKIEHSALNGDFEHRLPGNVNFCFEGIEGESLLLLLDDKGICASSGSACTSGSLDPSHVLLVIGRVHDVAHGSLRLTIDEKFTENDIDYVVKSVGEVVTYLRSISPVWRDLQNGKRKFIL